MGTASGWACLVFFCTQFANLLLPCHNGLQSQQALKLSPSTFTTGVFLICSISNPDKQKITLHLKTPSEFSLLIGSFHT